jgi:hypothetical protein
MATHVLNTTGDCEVISAKSYSTCHRGDGCHTTSTHSIQRVAGNREGETRKNSRGSTEGKTLVSLLGSRRNGDIINAVKGQPGVSLEQTNHRANDQVISPGMPIHPLLTSPTKRGANPINENNGGLSHSPAPLPLALSC